MTARQDERAFLKQVVELGNLYRWTSTHHDKSARKVGDVWISNIVGAKGAPDLLMVRPPRVLFCELKLGSRGADPARKRNVAGGTYGLTAEQEEWRALLEACPGVEYYVWTPADLDTIAAILRR